MTERKVASREERLMFEQIIRQDMQNGIQRTISSTPRTPKSYTPNNPQYQPQPQIQNQNQNQMRSPNSNLNYQNDNQNQNINEQNQIKINKGPKKTLAQKFNIRTNKGKRDAVWEQKRRIKNAKYEQLMQEEQEYYEQQQGSPKMTPQNINSINNENDMQYQRKTPNNQPRMTPQQQQYQRNTPNNQPRMTPQQQYEGTPNNQPRMTPQQQQYQRNTPSNQQRMNYPPEDYQRVTPNNNIQR